MNFLLSIFSVTFIIFCTPCNVLPHKNEADGVEISKVYSTLEYHLPTSTCSNEIPPDGKYTYEIAFAEWNGESMGVEVIVVIKGNLVKVIYEGVGKFTAEKGEILDEGILRKHKSGQWIISKYETDTEIDEIGGCTGGPSIIDFENKKFWIC